MYYHIQNRSIEFEEDEQRALGGVEVIDANPMSVFNAVMRASDLISQNNSLQQQLVAESFERDQVVAELADTNANLVTIRQRLLTIGHNLDPELFIRL